MEYGPPPLFNQGVSARARLAFFSFLAVVLIVVDARVKALELIRTGVGVALYPVQQLMLLPSEAIGRVGDYFTTVTHLQNENQRLRLNALEHASELLQYAHLREENAHLRRLIEAQERLGAPSLIAQVSYEAHDRFARKVIIDKGGRHGIQAGQPVLDPLGVIGQVTRIFPLTAEVTLITDSDQSIPVQILRNGLRGVAFGGARAGQLDLRFISADADVRNEDQLVTSGLDQVYPPGLPVATVIQVERNAKDQFARIRAHPIGGVHRNHFVSVLLVNPAPPLAGAKNTVAPRKGTQP